jgi:hypothetical protein
MYMAMVNHTVPDERGISGAALVQPLRQLIHYSAITGRERLRNDSKSDT